MGILLVGALLAAAGGLLCSVVMQNSLWASSWSLVAMLILAVGIPFTLGTLRPTTEWAVLPICQISPTVNLQYALLDAQQQVPYHRHWAMPSWDERMPKACAHVGLELALAVIFVALAARRIERDYRTGPPWRRATQR